MVEFFRRCTYLLLEMISDSKGGLFALVIMLVLSSSASVTGKHNFMTVFILAIFSYDLMSLCALRVFFTTNREIGTVQYFTRYHAFPRRAKSWLPRTFFSILSKPSGNDSFANHRHLSDSITLLPSLSVTEFAN